MEGERTGEGGETSAWGRTLFNSRLCLVLGFFVLCEGSVFFRMDTFLILRCALLNIVSCFMFVVGLFFFFNSSLCLVLFLLLCSLVLSSLQI